MPPTVEVGIASWHAIAGPFRRWPVLDLSHALGRHLVSTAPRRRTPIVQRRRPTGAVAHHPTVSLPFRQPTDAGGGAHRPAVLRDPLHQQVSTLRRQTRILVHVHPALPDQR
jgi:hypothetical protein